MLYNKGDPAERECVQPTSSPGQGEVIGEEYQAWARGKTELHHQEGIAATFGQPG
jgi:hypothetical protein